MKILTSIKVAQTAGIAQVVLSFMDFIEKSKGNNLSITAVNIINQEKKFYKKVSTKKTSTISFGIDVPNIAEVVNKAKNLAEVEKAYEKVISAYQTSIREEKPDLVLINGTYFMPWCLLLASERENVPAVLHYHGVLAKEVQNWKAKQRKIFLDMERCFDKKNMFYIFPSEITKNVVEKEVFKHKIKKSAVIPNPVSSHFFKEEDKTEKRNIGIVSRWAGIKNVRFCEELAHYNNKNGNKFVVNIITDLDKNSKIYKSLSKLVKFHNPKSNKNLASFYRNMGVVISPSHFETYGNVAKESIASGTPAMVSSNMGVSETFNILGLGDWIISFDSVKSVYEKIESIMGENVHGDVKNKMKELYVPSKIFNQMISILSAEA
ncbi:MAG: glycosyltransferase family 4 protein [Candidatus Staskawiczbacteria bacterium]|nr:glycosyltransferase family 4 protein [Candidatus Staskawiczbacteria bacterium]